MNSGRIYMDWAATAPLRPEVAQALVPFMNVEDNLWANANANSLHSEGRRAFACMEEARLQIARSFGARPNEIIFTSGATEADNAAICGMAVAAQEKRARKGRPVEHPHILTCAIEHDAVLRSARALEKRGFIIDVLPVDRGGFVSVDAVKEALRPDTVLVSIMLANNEVGSIEPIADISCAAHAQGALMHTDATQALGKIPFDLHALQVDAFSVSSHKIGGPKGVGALVLKRGTPFVPLLYGGGQEGGLRSGTQNVAGIVGFAAAVRALGTPADIEREAARQRVLRDELYRVLVAHPAVVPTVACEAGSRAYLPNIAHVCVRGLESETLILRFDHAGVALSGGSACSSHSLEPSHVLAALGVKRDTALCALRFSIGWATTEDDVARTLELFDTAIAPRALDANRPKPIQTGK